MSTSDGSGSRSSPGGSSAMRLAAVTSSGPPRVLVVDDEAPIRSSLRRLLAFVPYEVVEAVDGAQALARLAEADTAVIISDHHLDGMQGVDLLRQAGAAFPDTARILFSGHIDVELLRAAVNGGEVYRFVTKPWNDEELLAAVRDGVERWRLLRENRHLHADVEAQNRRLRRFTGELETLVQARTEEMRLRQRALQLSQEVLDRLPVAVIGLSPDGGVALVNEFARRCFAAVPGEDVAAALPPELAPLLAGGPPVTIATPIGRLRCELTDLGPRGRVLTGMPEFGSPD